MLGYKKVDKKIHFNFDIENKFIIYIKIFHLNG